ncbi:UNKNOWN [Stylonychia lemnae]|uniref:Uncharacterized protein n=1 Tax=Stylonychia lemnae TaxID=5949 RepID=A0A078AK04_STYLE|nr:UNKNOWN [Stylonychia lemnae]|eukprot:CDW82715.1 UNKNOWN [Stylonychia lemnae]
MRVGMSSSLMLQYQDPNFILEHMPEIKVSKALYHSTIKHHIECAICYQVADNPWISSICKRLFCLKCIYGFLAIPFNIFECPNKCDADKSQLHFYYRPTLIHNAFLRDSSFQCETCDEYFKGAYTFKHHVDFCQRAEHHSFLQQDKLNQSEIMQQSNNRQIRAIMVEVRDTHRQINAVQSDLASFKQKQQIVSRPSRQNLQYHNFRRQSQRQSLDFNPMQFSIDDMISDDFIDAKLQLKDQSKFYLTSGDIKLCDVLSKEDLEERLRLLKESQDFIEQEQQRIILMHQQQKEESTIQINTNVNTQLDNQANLVQANEDSQAQNKIEFIQQQTLGSHRQVIYVPQPYIQEDSVIQNDQDFIQRQFEPSNYQNQQHQKSYSGRNQGSGYRDDFQCDQSNNRNNTFDNENYKQRQNTFKHQYSNREYNNNREGGRFEDRGLTLGYTQSNPDQNYQSKIFEYRHQGRSFNNENDMFHQSYSRGRGRGFNNSYQYRQGESEHNNRYEKDVTYYRRGRGQAREYHCFNQQHGSQAWQPKQSLSLNHTHQNENISNQGNDEINQISQQDPHLTREQIQSHKELEVVFQRIQLDAQKYSEQQEQFDPLNDTGIIISKKWN